MRLLLKLIVRGYRRFVSPWKPGCCRFDPTCSAYALQALDRQSLPKALLLIAWRILRCQPFGAHGYDPVPDAGRWRHPQRQLWRGSRPLDAKAHSGCRDHAHGQPGQEAQTPAPPAVGSDADASTVSPS